MITINRYGEHYCLSEKNKKSLFGSMDNAKDYIRLHTDAIANYIISRFLTFIL